MATSTSAAPNLTPAREAGNLPPEIPMSTPASVPGVRIFGRAFRLAPVESRSCWSATSGFTSPNWSDWWDSIFAGERRTLP